MTDINIRLMTEPDIAKVLEMIEGLAAHHGDIAQIDAQTLVRDAREWITILVAEDAGGLHGYAGLCPLMQLQFGARGMDIHHLFVCPARRGHGIGRALIAGSVAHAKGLGCRFMMVGTHPDNAQAGQVYRAAGFQERPNGGPRFRMLL